MISPLAGRCLFCSKPLPEVHPVTLSTPPKWVDYGRLPAGDGWAVCGEACAGLPDGAVVFHR